MEGCGRLRKNVSSVLIYGLLAILVMGSLVFSSDSFAVALPTGTITVESPQNALAVGQSSSLNFSFYIPRLESPVGLIVDASDYLVNVRRNSTLFQCYLLAGVVLDYEWQSVVDTVSTHWSDLPSFMSLQNQSIDPRLSYSGNTKYQGVAILSGLSEGPHTATVWVRAEQNYMSFGYAYWAAFSETVNFTVDASPPKVSLLSPQATTYISSSVPLEFTVNEPALQFAYCLDGHNNVPISGNFTLDGLSDGTHNVVVYTNDIAGNMGKSDTVIFNVALPTPSPTIEPTIEPTQTATPTNGDNQTLDSTPILVLSGIAVVAVAVGALVYFMKRKRS